MHIGDPLEMATLAATGYKFENTANVSRNSAATSTLLPLLKSSDSEVKIQIKHRFPFNSTLKR